MDQPPETPAADEPPEHDPAETTASVATEAPVPSDAAAEPVPSPKRDTDAEDEAAKRGPKTFTAGTRAPTEFVRAPTIVIRRKRGGDHGAAHGGSWKIAYADFVTAMMAFFLLLWLLSSTGIGDLKGIADYFNRPMSALFTQGPGSTPTTVPQSDEERKAAEAQQLQALKTRLDALILQNPKLSSFKNQIKIDITSEGLRIQIIDDQNRPMFDKGDAVLKSYTKDILDQIGPSLNGVPNRISIAGHTDALPYHGPVDGYSNWELSSERANAARRELLSGGMVGNKILQIRGMADALPFYKNDPTNPANRRISIVVLNGETEANILRDGRQTNAGVPNAGIGAEPGAAPTGAPTAEPSGP
jgi:chemotaxis protein MotB